MSPLKKFIIGFVILFVVLTIIATYIRDFGSYSVIIGLVLIVLGFLGGGIAGEKYSIIKGRETTMEVSAQLNQRYYSTPKRSAIILLIIGAVMFTAGLLGYFLNSTFFPMYEEVNGLIF